jgi:hypothetical protein
LVSRYIQRHLCRGLARFAYLVRLRAISLTC